MAFHGVSLCNELRSAFFLVDVLLRLRQFCTSFGNALHFMLEFLFAGAFLRCVVLFHKKCKSIGALGTVPSETATLRDVAFLLQHGLERFASFDLANFPL